MNDADLPDGWQETPGALRFFSERVLDDGITISVRAALRRSRAVDAAGNPAVVKLLLNFTVEADACMSADPHHHIVSSYCDTLVDVEFGPLKAEFETLASVHANVAAAQVRAALAVVVVPA